MAVAVGMALVVLGLGGLVLMEWAYRRDDRADVTDPVAMEVRRLRRLIRNLAGATVLVVLVLVTWKVASDADRQAEDHAKDYVACVLAGRPDC